VVVVGGRDTNLMSSIAMIVMPLVEEEENLTQGATGH
jgi:hypothetical protein